MDGKQMGARLVYPMTAEDERDTGIGGWGERGLTLRQHFAGLVLQGLVSNERWFMNVVNANVAGSNSGRAEALAAEAAVAGADALLAELAKDQS